MTPLEKKKSWGGREEKTKGHLFYGLLSSQLSRFSTVYIRWRYKGYSSELPCCWIMGGVLG